jgi:SNF2 family DNA or RNA helicase
MNRADQLRTAQRKGTVGFALTSLQRRLASSPEAIYQSLKRRRNKLKRRVEEEKLRSARQSLGRDLVGTAPTGARGHLGVGRRLSPDDYENFEEAVVDQATAAQTIQELEGRDHHPRRPGRAGPAGRALRPGPQVGRAVALLQDTPEMRDADGRQRKLIIFTEHRDTLNYLAVKIRGLIGSEEAVVMIHGGVKREERRKVQELFRNDPTARVLIATDAAGEGVNLQNANLMVNYDLPWNPNRLEQRFGRIHRIGQTEVCHLWNMVARDPRGRRLPAPVREAGSRARGLGGRVFDILGEVFEETAASRTC